MNPRLTSPLAVGLFASIVSLVLGADATRFTPLFDGKSLEGWEVKGGKAKYEARDGAIVGTTVEGSPNTFLCTRKDYGDFELVLDVKCDKALNSGIQIRSHTYDKETVPEGAKNKKGRPAGTVFGYQCEIAESERGTSGSFYDEARRGRFLDEQEKKSDAAKKAFKDNEWNTYRIVAQGARIRSWVNGVACADFRDSLDKSGFIGLQVHSIRAGLGPFSVQWRNIRLRELKADEQVE
ncbi:MAG: DUF1080 domain-containing protein [Verrucomicrobia bacterium]|nr:DUF1080 domain-containing protein [Verrucomicrobiota bacterium]